MDNNLVKWNLIAGKIEALLLIAFGTITVGYVSSGELKLFLGRGWIRFTELFGLIMVIAGVAVLLFCRDNERDNVIYQVRLRGKDGLIWRLVGIGLLVLTLGGSLITPYFTVLEDPFTTKVVGGSTLSGVKKSRLTASRGKEPEARNYLDWMILFANNNDLSIFEGENAVVTGVVFPDRRLPDGYFFLRRDLVTHCDTCAEAVSITCRVKEGDKPPADGEWIQVKGEFSRRKVVKQNVLVLDVKEYGIRSRPDISTISL